MQVLNDNIVSLLKGEKGDKGEPSPGIQKIEIEERSFGNMSWSEIAEISEAGKAREYFSVGDEKTIELTNGNHPITLVILGFDHDDLSDGSGKAGITIGTKYMPAILAKINSTVTNAGGWDECMMRTNVMADWLLELPSDLQSVIKQVNKKASAGNASSSITTSADKLWLLAMSEIFSATSIENAHLTSLKDDANTYKAEGTQYEYYRNLIGDNNGSTEANPLLIKYIKDRDGEIYAHDWWLRSSTVGDTNTFYNIFTTGALLVSGVNSSKGIAVCFCV